MYIYKFTSTVYCDISLLHSTPIKMSNYNLMFFWELLVVLVIEDTVSKVHTTYDLKKWAS